MPGKRYTNKDIIERLDDLNRNANKEIIEKLEQIDNKINEQKEFQVVTSIWSLGLSFWMFSLAVLITLSVTLFHIISSVNPALGIDIMVFLFEMLAIAFISGLILMFFSKNIGKWIIKTKKKK